TKKSYAKEYGTSFSTPLVAGFAACAWQLNPSWNNMKLYNEIQKSGHLYPYYDYVHGFGVPQATYFTNGPDNAVKSQMPKPSFSVDTSTSNVMVILTDSISKMNEQERDADLMYYHFSDPDGMIKQYYVVRPDQRNILESGREGYPDGWLLRIHYKGYTE